MKKAYIIEKISTIVCLSLILFDTWRQFLNNPPSLIPILVIPIYFLLRSKFFKNVEYETKKDYIFDIINVILVFPTIILAIYMMIYR